MAASGEVQDAGRRVAAPVGDEIYLLLPDDGPQYFLAEGALIGIGGVLLGAFLRGVTASAEKRVEAWGKQVGDWLLRKIEKVVTDEDPATTGSAEAEEALADAGPSGVMIDESSRREVAQVMVVVLTGRGVSAQRAEAAVAEAVSQAVRLVG